MQTGLFVKFSQPKNIVLADLLNIVVLDTFSVAHSTEKLNTQKMACERG